MSPTPEDLDALLEKADRTMAELLMAEPGQAQRPLWTLPRTPTWPTWPPWRRPARPSPGRAHDRQAGGGRPSSKSPGPATATRAGAAAAGAFRPPRSLKPPALPMRTGRDR